MTEWMMGLGDGGPVLVCAGIFLLLILGGFGFPIPEDIPVIVAGFMAAQRVAPWWLLLPGCFVAIMFADLALFGLGRRYGHQVCKLPMLRRILTDDRVGRAEARLNAHGGKFLIAARFVPGMRAPAFFSAGMLRVSLLKFLLYDGGAALVCVPLVFGLAYVFSEQMSAVKWWVRRGEIVIAGVIVAGVIIGVLIRWRRRSVARRGAAPDPRPGAE